MDIKEKIEKFYQIPCGPMSVSADSVCRRGLKDSHDRLLDRLTKEIHPLPVVDKLPKDSKVDGNLIVGFDESSEDNKIESKKERMIKEGKMRAEVKLAIKKYEEELQGNSKLLQDPTGKITPW